MQVNPQDFAAKLKHWASHGFPELGDVECSDIGTTTNSLVVRHKSFETDPHEVN